MGDGQTWREESDRDPPLVVLEETERGATTLTRTLAPYERPQDPSWGSEDLGESTLVFGPVALPLVSLVFVSLSALSLVFGLSPPDPI
jgi:hypothetical protein